MTGFILIGLALLTGDLIPWMFRVLMLVGGVLSLAAPLMGGGQSRGDPGAELSLSDASRCAGRRRRL